MHIFQEIISQNNSHWCGNYLGLYLPKLELSLIRNYCHYPMSIWQQSEVINNNLIN